MYLRAGGVPTRHTHKWDGLHTRHLLESTHTNTHKHTIYLLYGCRPRHQSSRPTNCLLLGGCCFDQELLLLVEGDICVQNHRGLPIVSLDLALLLQAVDGLHPNALPLP